MGSLEGNEGYGRADYFLVDKDFPSYLECQEEVDKASRDKKNEVHEGFGNRGRIDLGLDDDFNYKEELDLDAALKRK
ncbi:glycogen phosphorylase [Trifolium repens]|nr:glycogen phosphorylase [Trifolium repens]